MKKIQDISRSCHIVPFLLVDKVLESEGTTGWCGEDVTINEHFFEGHFPEHPVMPASWSWRLSLSRGASLVQCR